MSENPAPQVRDLLRRRTSCDLFIGEDSETLHAWIETPRGTVLWTLDVRLPPGQMQIAHLIPGT